jgi:hypothetical protein
MTIPMPNALRCRWMARGLWLACSFALVPASADAPGPQGAEPWTQRAKLVAPDGAIDDFLGRAVAIDGDTAVVGAAGADIDGRSSQGAAYVYVRSGDAWLMQDKLISPDGAAGDEFGFAVAISGDTIVVGARFAMVDGIDGKGAAYVFVRSGAKWIDQAKLDAKDGAAFDQLGFSVSADRDTVLAGAPFANGSQGRVVVFTRSGSAWSAQATLLADDGAASDRFGLSVSVAADTALVGSPSADVEGSSDQGAAYVFARSGSAWEMQTKLTGEDSEAFDEFGNAVALDGDTAVIGAHVMNIGSNGNQGAAYAFLRSGSAWSQQAKLLADDGSFTDEFGFSVAVSGDTAVVGALFANPGGSENQGEAYVFERSGVAWSQQARLISDGVAGDEFGIAVAISADTAVVGAEFGSTDGEWRGAAYVFSDALPAARAEITPQELSFELASGAAESDSLDIANVGEPGSTLLFSNYEASGADCGVPGDIAWLSFTPPSGEVAAGSLQQVTITADATGLAAGDYSALVCVTTSDPMLPVLPVAVALHVSGPDPDVIFIDGFDTR